MTKKNKIIDLFSKKNSLEDNLSEQLKYSELLDEFTAKFGNEFSKDWFIEDVFDFAVIAWNLGNISLLMPPEELTQAIAENSASKEQKNLMRKMIKHKRNHFSEYERFITDCEVEEGNSDNFKLTVATQDKEGFLTAMMEEAEAEAENETSSADMVENYIDRQAIIIKPKQALLEWFHTIDPEDKNREIGEPNVYMVSEEIEDVENWIRKKFNKFFEMELEDWTMDKKKWPNKRNFKMFMEWFDVDVSTMVYDLEKRPVFKGE